jgi:CRP/FNR family transcriptional regulator
MKGAKMSNEERARKALSELPEEAFEEIFSNSQLVEIPDEQEILREGEYVAVIPLVLKGLIKVYTSHDERELLLYYIKPDESCIMSFAASLQNEPSKIFAITEEPTTALLLPSDKVRLWVKKYHALNRLFYLQYNVRYTELLETIDGVLFERMDSRIYNYLSEKKTLLNKDSIKISHRQIANDLGTAREVVSRIIKKLEHEGKVVQESNLIKIL